MTKSKSDYSIQTVKNAFRVLEVFHDEDEIGVSGLSRRLGLHKNNVFRLLATLEEQGYIEQSLQSERYRLGVRCLELGRAFARSNTLLKGARTILEELTQELGESAHLGIMQDFEVVHLDGEQPQRMVLSAPRVGERLPAHSTALGKVLLGCSDESVRERFDREIIAKRGLAACTSATITDRDKFLEHLNSVSLQGAALDLEECEAGLCCAAAPVQDRNGRVHAAISVSGPMFRFSTDVLVREIVPAVTAAAARLSTMLGRPG